MDSLDDSIKNLQKRIEEYALFRSEVVNVARTLLNSMLDEERLSLFREYCCWCGSDDSQCNCMRDE